MQMEERENYRKQGIVSTRARKDTTMERTAAQKDWDLMMKKEMDMIRQEDKKENIDRIMKAQDYKK